MIHINADRRHGEHADQRHRHGHRHGRQHAGHSQTFPVLTIPSRYQHDLDDDHSAELNTVTTPISTPGNNSTTFQLSATNPTGGTLCYTVQGGLVNDAFTTDPPTPTATVSSTGLVTVTPNTGYSGPINLVVGVTDQTNRAGPATARLSGELLAPERDRQRRLVPDDALRSTRSRPRSPPRSARMSSSSSRPLTRPAPALLHRPGRPEQRGLHPGPNATATGQTPTAW